MKVLLLILILMPLSGCNISSPEYKAKVIEAGEIRIELFKQCMELVANVNKATTQHYNDLDEVVVSCRQSAYYMSNQVMGI